MRLTYRIPPHESVSYHLEFAREQGKKIVPRWMREALGIVFLGANFVIALWLTTSVDRALALTVLIWLVHWSWQKGAALVSRKMTIRYFGSLPGSDIWTSEVTDDRLVVGSRGVLYSFPLPELSRLHERDNYLYLEFSTLGRTRIPFSAFQSVSDRFEFVRILDLKRKPSQLPGPTAPGRG